MGQNHRTMRIIPSLLFFTLLIYICSCSTDEEPIPDDEPLNDEPVEEIESVEIETNPDWTTIDFKPNYTIQFPEFYSGNGMVGWEGTVFSMEREDESIRFSYNYCSSVYCEEFGSELYEDIPLQYTEYRHPDIWGFSPPNSYFHKTQFIENEKVKGHLYFTEPTDHQPTNANGIYHMLHRGSFREAVSVTFPFGSESEVIEILKTIQPRSTD